MSSVSGTYSSFSRTAWVSLAMATLLFFVGIKFIVVDQVSQPLPFVFGGSLCFGLWPAVTLLWRGTFELDERGIRGRRRIGLAFEIPREEIVDVANYGSRKGDSLGVKLTLENGKRRVLVRVKPESALHALLRLPNG